MKLFLLILLVVACTCVKEPSFDDMKKCIQERCPDQYKKCMGTSGCEDKLMKCAGKCGIRLNTSCWSLCVGVTGAASNAALCAVNQGCLNISKLDRIGLTLMTAIHNIRNQ